MPTPAHTDPETLNWIRLYGDITFVAGDWVVALQDADAMMRDGHSLNRGQLYRVVEALSLPGPDPIDEPVVMLEGQCDKRSGGPFWGARAFRPATPSEVAAQL